MFLSRIESVHRLGVEDSKQVAKEYAPASIKVACKINGKVYEAEGEETLHAHIYCRVLKAVTIDTHVDGFTIKEIA